MGHQEAQQLSLLIGETETFSNGQRHVATPQSMAMTAALAHVVENLSEVAMRTDDVRLLDASHARRTLRAGADALGRALARPVEPADETVDGFDLAVVEEEEFDHTRYRPAITGFRSNL